MPHRSRPPQTDPPSSDSEVSDAPEYISLSQSKKNIQKLDTERRNAQAAQRRANKEKKREIDRKLKERAATNKSAGKDRLRPAQNVVQDELEMRMHRAMQEADEETGESAYGKSDEEDFSGINYHEHDSDSDQDPDSDGSLSSTPNAETSVRPHLDHLPDELFAAAFSASSKRKLIDDAPLKRPEKKKRKSTKDKDIIVGSRVIRILPDPSAPPVPSTTPSQKVNSFLDRSLALTDPKQNLYTRGWERRPVNVGVLKRDGPPISFVRNR